MDEACGNATESLATYPQGRWLPWTDDHLDQEGLDAGLINAQHKLLTELAEPFIRLDVLTPPPGVEARPHRSIGERRQMGEPVAGAKLMIQIFHPSFKQAGESTAGVKVYVNTLLPLFYGIGGGEIKDDDGPMFAEPIRVGEMGGADVYWSGRPRDCLVVYKAYKKPLWKPVSQERYLRAQIHFLEKKTADSHAGYRAEKRRQEKQANDSLSPAQEQELLRQLRATNPAAAAEMEKQLAAMRQMMQNKSPAIQKEVDAEYQRTKNILEPGINKFRAELAAMTPAQRAAPAYLGGIHGSKATLLSRPDDTGARALVAPARDYLSGKNDYSSAQLLVIEFSSSANHPPETVINTRLRKELDWRQFWRFVGKQ